MRFLAPGFALFAALFVVPLLVHLIGRSRAKVRRFAPIDLLLRSERRVATRTKLREILLLVLRALAIAAVPLILAKPFYEAASDLPGAVTGAQSAVIVLDDSLSMTAVLDGQSLLERGKARARRILKALGRDAELALVVGSRGAPRPAPVGDLTTDRARISRALDEVKPSARATDLSTALKRAAQILTAAGRPEKRVYLVSDLQASGFDADPPWAADAGIELVPVDVTDGKPPPNRAVVDLRVEPAPHLGPRGVRVSVDVANHSDAAVKDLPVTLRIGGKPVAKGLVEVPARERVTKRFFHTFARAAGGEVGVHDVQAELEPDALAADDRRWARVEVRRDVRALVVDGDPRTVRRDDEVFYLETALRPGDRADSQLDVVTVTADELQRQRLADFDVVFLANVKPDLDARVLREFVDKGGGLFISAGSNVDPDAWNQRLGELLPQPLHSVRDGEQRIGRVEREHPALAPLSLKDDPFREVKVSRYLLFKPTQGGDRQVTLRLEDGAPLLIERALGQGRVMLLATTVDRDWSDLPIQPIFLPLVQQAARHLARAPLHEPDPPVVVGQRQDIGLEEGDQRVEVTLPSGATRLFDRDRVVGRKALAFTDTGEPGVYRVAVSTSDRGGLKPRPQHTFVVNVDPVESDLQRIPDARLARLRAGAGATAAAGQAPKRRVELWHALGAALLVMLLGEAVLLRRK